MTQLILVRHGQSQWNLENRFTGWWDADLTEQGQTEAYKGGHLLKDAGIAPAHTFTSYQTRAIRTAWIILHATGRAFIPVEKHWRLNERHYGNLTGLDKTQMAAHYGAEQIHIWRRSYDTPPPPMDTSNQFNLSADPRYAGINIPQSESLKDTLERVLPYWDGAIRPVLTTGKTTLVSAHGNSLRAIMKHLFHVSNESITTLEIPTGNPLLIELNDDLQPVSSHYLDHERAQPLPDGA